VPRDRQVVRILGILKMLAEGGRLNVYQLAARFRVRRETIYRDLKALADVDRVLELPLRFGGLEEAADLPIASVRLNVQVKQKAGVDLNDTEGIEQLVKMSSGARNEYPILVSTADDFTPDCQRLARENGVALINGKQLARIVMKSL
jgi:DNA-binding transcriptional ArsR family regulator